MIPARFAMLPMRWWSGNKLYEILPLPDGSGYVGVCDGKIIIQAADPAHVARDLILPARKAQADP